MDLTLEQLRTIPERARLQLLARCARRMYPLVGAFWRDMPVEVAWALQQLIEEFQQVANGIVEDSASSMSLRAVLENSLSYIPNTLEAHNAKVNANSALEAILKATRGTTTAEEVMDAIEDCWFTAYILHMWRCSAPRLFAKAFTEAVIEDFRRVQTVTANDQRNDEAGNPDSIFGPLWPPLSHEAWQMIAEQTDFGQYDLPPGIPR